MFGCKKCFKRFKRKDHLEKHRCSADSTQSAGFGLPTMVDTNQLAITPTRGHKLLFLSECKSAYNFWKINSEISVHQSNGRQLVNISKEDILIQVADIKDPNISLVETKRGLKLQAHKRITSKAYLRLHEDFKKL